MNIQDTYNTLRAEYAMDILTYLNHKKRLIKEIGEEMYNKVFGQIETKYQVKISKQINKKQKTNLPSLNKTNTQRLKKEMDESLPDFLKE